MPPIRKKVNRIDQAVGTEISYVDRPSNHESKIVGVTVLKRETADIDKALAFVPEESRGWFAKAIDALFGKKELTSESRDNISDDKFAYIDSKGGKHLPIHDASHVRNALARFNQTHFESDSAKAKARAKVAAAAKRLGVETSDDKSEDIADLCKKLESLSEVAAQLDANELDTTEACTEINKVFGALTADSEEEDMPTMEEILKAIRASKTGDVLEKKMNADDREAFKMAKRAFSKAHSSFGKAAGKNGNGDDDDFQDGMTYHKAGMDHMEKMDTPPPTDEQIGGGSDVVSPTAAGAGSPYKAEDIGNLVKAAVTQAKDEFAKELEPLRAELAKAQTEKHELELRLAKAEAKNEALGSMPIQPKAIIGNPFTNGQVFPVNKGQNTPGVQNNGTDPLAITDADLNKVSASGVPTAFHKAFSKARQNPIPVNDPNFHGSMVKGAT